MKKAEFLKEKERIKSLLIELRAALASYEDTVASNVRKGFEEAQGKILEHYGMKLGDEPDRRGCYNMAESRKRPTARNYVREVEGLTANTKEYYKHPWIPIYDVDARDTEKLNKVIEREIQAMLENLRYKLDQAICRKTVGLEIESIEKIYVRVGGEGFEGSFKLTLKNGETQILDTQAIYAGGYNIQRLHFRYLSKLR